MNHFKVWKMNLQQISEINLGVKWKCCRMDKTILSTIPKKGNISTSGPLVTALLETRQTLRNVFSKSPVVPTSNRRRQLCLVYVLSSLSVASYLANLYLAEGGILRQIVVATNL